MIVYDTNDNTFHKRFMRESDLTLLRTISSGHAAEQIWKHALKILQSQSTANCHKINNFCKPCHQAPNEESKEIIKCKPCNGSHPRGKCLAYGKLCLNCNRKNHFKVCCPQNGKRYTKLGKLRVTVGEFQSWIFCINNYHPEPS